MSIKPGALEMRIQSRGSSPSFLRITSWQITQDLAQLLQLLGPTSELLSEIISTEEYYLDILVLSEDGSLGYRSRTNRETILAIQEGSISNWQWELLANGYYEEF